MAPFKDFNFMPIMIGLAIILIISIIKIKKDFPYGLKEMVHDFNSCLIHIEKSLDEKNIKAFKKEYKKLNKIYEKIAKSDKLSDSKKKIFYKKIKEVNEEIRKKV
jgi:hypothetical protein